MWIHKCHPPHRALLRQGTGDEEDKVEVWREEGARQVWKDKPARLSEKIGRAHV